MTNVKVDDDCYLQQQQDVMVTLGRVKHPQGKGIERKESTKSKDYMYNYITIITNIIVNFKSLVINVNKKRTSELLSMSFKSMIKTSPDIVLNFCCQSQHHYSIMELPCDS